MPGHAFSTRSGDTAHDAARTILSVSILSEDHHVTHHESAVGLTIHSIVVWVAAFATTAAVLVANEASPTSGQPVVPTGGCTADAALAVVGAGIECGVLAKIIGVVPARLTPCVWRGDEVLSVAVLVNSISTDFPSVALYAHHCGNGAKRRCRKCDSLDLRNPLDD